jgi:hypothetical protein
VVNLSAAITPSLYEGTIVRAQILVGSQRLLSLLPLIGRSIGG